MFAHGGFWHIAMNMLALFFFGPPLEARWGSREFLKYYLICGLGGAVLSFVFAPQSPIIGASAAVYGIMLAFAMSWPDAPIYIYAIFPVKAKYLVGVMGMLSFFAMFQGGGDNIAHAAHLGGFAAGLPLPQVQRSARSDQPAEEIVQPKTYEGRQRRRQPLDRDGAGVPCRRPAPARRRNDGAAPTRRRKSSSTSWTGCWRRSARRG